MHAGSPSLQWFGDMCNCINSKTEVVFPLVMLEQIKGLIRDTWAGDWVELSGYPADLKLTLTHSNKLIFRFLFFFYTGMFVFSVQTRKIETDSSTRSSPTLMFESKLQRWDLISVCSVYTEGDYLYNNSVCNVANQLFYGNIKQMNTFASI